MEVITRELRALATARAVTAGTAVGQLIDIGARAPIGAMVNRITLGMRALTVLASQDSLIAGVFEGLDDSEATVEAIITPGAAFADINNRILIKYTSVWSVITSGGGQMGREVLIDFSNLPTAARPLTFNGWTLGMSGNASGGDVQADTVIYYQLVRLSDAEIAAVIAAAP